MYPPAHNANKRCYSTHSSRGWLPVRRARGTCGVGANTILTRMFRTTSYSYMVRYEEEDDTGVIFNCFEGLFNVTVVLFELENFMHCYFYIALLLCFDVHDREHLS